VQRKAVPADWWQRRSVWDASVQQRHAEALSRLSEHVLSPASSAASSPPESLWAPLRQLSEVLAHSDVWIDDTATVALHTLHTALGCCGTDRALCAAVQELAARRKQLGTCAQSRDVALLYHTILLSHTALLACIPRLHAAAGHRSVLCHQVLRQLRQQRCEVDGLALHYAVHALWLAGDGRAALTLLHTVQPAALDAAVTSRRQRAAVVPQLLWERNPRSWVLDVHGLGPAVAAVVVVAWVLQLRELHGQGALPRRVGVVTGWGNHRCVVGYLPPSIVQSQHQARSRAYAAEERLGTLRARGGCCGRVVHLRHSRSRGRSVVRLTVANVLHALASPLLPSQLEQTVRVHTQCTPAAHGG
jgi:hypothetical protein